MTPPGATLGTETYATANPLNQYPSVTPIGGSAATLTYDLNGNLTGDGSGTYTYDATNRLLAIAGFVTASYGYDALDRRTQKTTGGSTTRFLHAGSDEIAEYTSAGALLRRYVPGPGTDERAAMIDSGLASPPATAIKYPHTDRQGSVMAVTSSTGAVTERFAYDGFGRSSSAFSGYPFRYTGQRLDFESGLMFYKARVYSTALGRFLQTDPIGTKDDLNLYAYVGNDPINKTDPTGQEDYSQHPVINDMMNMYLMQVDTRQGEFVEGLKWSPVNLAYETAYDLPAFQNLPFSPSAGELLGAPTPYEMMGSPSKAEQAGLIAGGLLISAVTAKVPNPFGRLGGPLHRAKVADVASDIRSRGLWAQIERHIPTPNGAKSSRFADVAAIDPLTDAVVELHQVGRQTWWGQIPVRRERQAIVDISVERPDTPLFFHPYN